MIQNLKNQRFLAAKNMIKNRLIDFRNKEFPWEGINLQLQLKNHVVKKRIKNRLKVQGEIILSMCKWMIWPLVYIKYKKKRTMSKFSNRWHALQIQQKSAWLRDLEDHFRMSEEEGGQMLQWSTMCWKLKWS